MKIPVLQTFFLTRIVAEYFNKEAARVRLSSPLGPIALAKELARREQGFFSAKINQEAASVQFPFPLDPAQAKEVALYEQEFFLTKINKKAASVQFPFSLDPALAKGVALYEQEVNVEHRAKETFKARLQKKGKKLEEAEKLIELIPDSPDHIDFLGQGVDYESMRAGGVDVQELEEDQELQNAVMTAYNLATLFVKEASVAKWIISDKDIRGKIYIEWNTIDSQ